MGEGRVWCGERIEEGKGRRGGVKREGWWEEGKARRGECRERRC